MWFDKWEMKFLALFSEDLQCIKMYTLILLYDIMWSKLMILKLVAIVTANISAMIRKKVFPLAAVPSVAHTYKDG